LKTYPRLANDEEVRMSVEPIPHDHRAAIPYLNVPDGATAVAFYERAFGARAAVRLERPDGQLAHAELRIGEAQVMVRTEIPELGFRAPTAVGGTPTQILVYVGDAAALVEQAWSAGAHVVRPVEEQFHGDVMATVEDPFGHVWLFATHVEDVDAEDLARRSAEHEPVS
jgi:PhnB protein